MFDSDDSRRYFSMAAYGIETTSARHVDSNGPLVTNNLSSVRRSRHFLFWRICGGTTDSISPHRTCNDDVRSGFGKSIGADDLYREGHKRRVTGVHTYCAVRKLYRGSYRSDGRKCEKRSLEKSGAYFGERLLLAVERQSSGSGYNSCC